MIVRHLYQHTKGKKLIQNDEICQSALSLPVICMSSGDMWCDRSVMTVSGKRLHLLKSI